MTRVLRIRPEVEQDIREAGRWYDEREIGLGEEFLRAVYSAMAGVGRHPNAFTRVHGRFRRSLIPRFPFARYYTSDRGTTIVFALFHCARSPMSLRELLRARRPKSPR